MIRFSTDPDVQAIHAWLVEQQQQKIAASFLCNWELTVEKHKQGKLLVYIDEATGEPVAYEWGGLRSPGILEVRHDMRGRQIGRAVVEHCINEARKQDHCFLYIQCQPPESIGFWKHMGFTIFESAGGDTYGYQILEKKYALPREAQPIEVCIRFFPERKKWETGTAALIESKQRAARTSDGVCHLSQRVAFFPLAYPDCGDPLVEIQLAGKQVYFDKAKTSAAKNLGVVRCNQGFQVNQLRSLF